MSEENRMRPIINADRVIINADEVIVIEANDRRRRHRRDHFDGVAGAQEDRDHHDDVLGAEENRRRRRHPWW